MPRSSAADTLAFRIEDRARDRGRRDLGVIGRILGAASRGDAEDRFDAIVARRASGAVVLRGPVSRGLRRFLRTAVEGDLSTMTESEFLAAWGGSGGWQQRYDRWRERGWAPPVR